MSGVFAAYRIVVIDAHTGEIFASRPATASAESLPWMETPTALWPKTPNDLSDAERVTLQADVSKLIDSTLLRTLARLKLTR